MPRPDPRKNTRVSFAIARDEPIGIVIAAFNSRLSRAYHWDLETDTFKAGQFLKARATVDSISPDGKLFAYRAVAFHKVKQAYSCISRVPFFTDQAFFPHSPNTFALIEFQEDGSIIVISTREDCSWVQNYHLIQERISPGLSDRIVRQATVEEMQRISDRFYARQTWLSQSPVDDPKRNRTLYVSADKILVSYEDPSKRVLLAEFLKEPFEAIEPPEWATRW